jgi:hypothetical protein
VAGLGWGLMRWGFSGAKLLLPLFWILPAFRAIKRCIEMFLLSLPKNRRFVDSFFFLSDTASTAIGEGAYRI